MHSASRGAKENKGITVGILPGDDYSALSEYVDIPIVTGLGNARNNIKEIVDAISDKNEIYIVTRDSNPEVVIMSYKKYLENKKLLNQIWELKYESSIKKSQLQFKEWLNQKGYDVNKLSEEEICKMIKNLQINNNIQQ